MASFHKERCCNVACNVWKMIISEPICYLSDDDKGPVGMGQYFGRSGVASRYSSQDFLLHAAVILANLI